ncbi:MAG: hypothetical protein KGN36_05565, partial [Acidobacteriota bacterium]|nr:hypothetical protein [Acidobacteriota bacterium]
DTGSADGSITGSNPAPSALAVSVNAGTLALETGPLTPWPGMIAGLYRVQARLPASTIGGLRAVPLTVTVDGVLAAPFVFFDKVYQAGGWVWMGAR